MTGVLHTKRVSIEDESILRSFAGEEDVKQTTTFNNLDETMVQTFDF